MKNKGISLIVLIITIVVIIILAAAIILNLSNTNLIENANEAVVKQDVKSFQDELTMYKADKYVDTLGKFKAEELDVTDKEEIAKIIPSIKGTKYENYVVIKDGELAVVDTTPEPTKTWLMESLGLTSTQNIVPTEPDSNGTPVIAVNTTVTTANATITGKEFAYNNPIIPVGFKAVNTSKASWLDGNNDGIVDGWNNGLVLVDSENNEYVWVPVDGINVTYSKWNGSQNTDYTVTKEQIEDDTLPSGVATETDQITKYGGFYVSRYEAGLPDSQTTEEMMLTKKFTVNDNNRIDIGKAQSKPNKIVWVNLDYNNAKILAEKVVETDYVQSGMITGTQWDTMLTFLSQEVNVDTDCTAWGNYKNKYGYTISGYYRTVLGDVVYTKGGYSKSEEGNLFLETGKFGSVVSSGSPKNIFDVAGNAWEWSTEIVAEKGGIYTTVGHKILRGGCYIGVGDYNVASYRVGGSVDAYNHPYIGIRFVLYVK